METTATFLPAPLDADAWPAHGPGLSEGCSNHAPRLSTYGQQLIGRVTQLAGVRLGGQGYRGMKGTPICVDPSAVRCSEFGFLHKRIFAVVRDSGAMCLRLPETCAEDLIENGMAIRQGKDVLCNAPISDYQLEFSWQLLLHAYWLVTQADHSHQYTILTEHIIRHLRDRTMQVDRGK
jgi:hypothetical protein